MALNNEVRNLLRYCANPIVAARTKLFFVWRVLFSFQYRCTPSRWYYPKEVREAIGRIRNHESGIRNAKIQAIPIGRGRLKLATGFLEYDDKPHWQKVFDDPEQTMSLHRWGWLIYDGMEKEQGLALMRSWLSVIGPVPKGITGTPYTTSERIVNALLFFSNEEVPDDIRAALLAMAYHLARNIEYHGRRATGNHVVNNARALFFAGQVLKAKELSDLALAIVKEALPWLVTRDGFLREESSHYHLLFTRWLTEMHELAKGTDHQEMRAYLEPWVRKCAEKCWFFLMQTPTPPGSPPRAGGESPSGRWNIPLIGDVSPDCPPEWLIKYLISSSEQYFPSPQPSPPEGGEGVLSTFPLPAGEGRVRGMQAFPESGWFRLDHGATTIFWHVPQSNMIHRATHGHNDLCSFVLFHKGKPIIIDPGRPTYQGDEGCLARDHNALTVDGLDPFLYDRAQKFPAFYQKRDVRVDWQEDGQDFIFTILHTGFQRSQGDRIDHTRRFRVGYEFLEVEDELRGRRAHAVETFFHFAPGVDQVGVQNSAGARKVVAGFTSSAYGVKINSSVIVVSHKDQFPFTINYKIEL